MNQSGFTLVETLVSLLVTTFISLVIGNFMVQNIQESSLATARETILQDTQLSLDLAANDVRLSANADDNNRWADLNAPGGSLQPYSWASDASTLVLATGAQNTSGVIQFLDAKNYVTEKNNLIYFVKNGTLYKRTLAATTVVPNAAKTTCPAAAATTQCPADKSLIRNVTLFTVAYLDGDNNAVDPTVARSIELHVKVSKQLYKQTVGADYTTRMVFRN